METTQNKTVDRDQTQSSQTDGSNTSSSEANQSSDQFNRGLESTNPDSRLAITTQDGAGVIEYASGIEEHTNKATTDTTGSSNDTTSVTGTATANINEIEDYIESKVGKTGDQTYSKMLKEYRETFLNIEKMIFKEMNELFMLVY
jgi:hypothetical protein